MFEFVGAIAGRSMMIEGTINSQALMSSALGMASIHWVSFYTQESALGYYAITFKFILSWMVLSSILGCISIALAGGKVIQDPSPKTRAWYEGPRLMGWMRATREVGSCIGSVFLGMDPQYEVIINKGVGWEGLALIFVSLWIMLTISESIQDRVNLSFQKELLNKVACAIYAILLLLI